MNSMTAEDERRHNVAHMSYWLSVKDLVAQAAQLCSPILPKTSVRLQFTRRNTYSHAALSFSSRFNVQHKIQRPLIRAAWTDSLSPVQGLIRSRFERLSLKDKQIKTRDSISDQAVDELKNHLRKLFPTIDLDKLQKATLSKNMCYQQWVETHCRQRQYAFQIRKCDDVLCCGQKTSICNWLPDPVLSEDVGESRHFKSFDEVYGSETTETDRPTFVAPKVTQKKKQNHQCSCCLHNTTILAASDSLPSSSSAPVLTASFIVKSGSVQSPKSCITICQRGLFV